MLYAIVAMSENRVIGRNNQLPWHLPNDLKHFKALTLNHVILMGRKTYDSIGKPLPNRTNVILTRDLSFKAEGCMVMHSLDEVLQKFVGEDIFLIGGAEIFNLTLSKVDKIFLTIVHAQIEGDVFFPELKDDEWETVSLEKHKQISGHDYDYSFVQLQRK